MTNRDLRISEFSRKKIQFTNPLFETDADLDQMYRQAQKIVFDYNKIFEKKTSAGKVYSCAILHYTYQYIISEFCKETDTSPFERITVLANKNDDCKNVLNFYDKNFPSELDFPETEEKVRAFFVHQVFLANPAAINAMKNMVLGDNIKFPSGTRALNALLGSYLKSGDESEEDDLFFFLTYPARLYPNSLEEQILFILEKWDYLLPEKIKFYLQKSINYIKEEEKPHFDGGKGEVQAPNLDSSDIESFSQDRLWMPNVVMMAKSTLVWLDQLSKKYRRNIATLDAIPDEELDLLRERGFTALWLIGLWERSPASKKIKNLCGNPDAESSAYSLKGYEIAARLGGWSALENLRERCVARGIRLASDMVPNHTGLDSPWVKDHDNYFISQDFPPFPAYTYNGENLSTDPEIEIKIEDHYFDRTDAAVTFRKRDFRTGKTTYIFHGNDGTSMAWNDTAQLDFLNPETREAVIQEIIHIAQNFQIIRFDAAMTLAKRHIQRLWYPQPGCGGDIAGRAPHSMTTEEFNKKIPVEFWREVVDRIAVELPDTLLLAEAFWMMEGYFVRTLGMHRVYNSAFMHMLKNEDNKKYRDSIKSTLLFDPEILKRYVNFMSNPDEETAIAQFGNGDKYFGVCTVLATMPGLPMFGHGQIEGFKEKYGMEYQRAYWDEKPDESLIQGHYQKIFPLLKMRHLFSGCDKFNIYDAYDNGEVQESIFAYTNGVDKQMTLVLYNNRYEHAQGTIKVSAPKLVKATKETKTTTLAQEFNLVHSIRHFVTYKNCNDGLTYIVPSIKIYNDGFFVSLNGYETKVFTNINEHDDIDGMYEKLYLSLNGRGVEDIDIAIKLMYLEPFFNACEPLISQKTVKDIKTVLSGKSQLQNIKNIMNSLGNCYAFVEELRTLASTFGLEIHSIKPSIALKTIKKIENICSFPNAISTNSIILDNLTSIMQAFLIIKPFTNNYTTLEEAINIVDTLMLDRLLNKDKYIVKLAAILACSQSKKLQTLLRNATFKNLIGCNFYNGVNWYNGEKYQLASYIALFSDCIEIDKVDCNYFDKSLRYMLDLNNNAEYKADNLLRWK